jgi:hypothetical protein
VFACSKVQTAAREVWGRCRPCGCPVPPFPFLLPLRARKARWATASTRRHWKHQTRAPGLWVDCPRGALACPGSTSLPLPCFLAVQPCWHLNAGQIRNARQITGGSGCPRKSEQEWRPWSPPGLPALSESCRRHYLATSKIGVHLKLYFCEDLVFYRKEVKIHAAQEMELEGFNEWLRNRWERSSSGEVFCSSRRIPNFSCIVDFSAAGGGRLAALVRSQSQMPRQLGDSETGAFTGDPPLLRLAGCHVGLRSRWKLACPCRVGGTKLSSDNTTAKRIEDTEKNKRHATGRAPFSTTAVFPRNPPRHCLGRFG